MILAVLLITKLEEKKDLIYRHSSTNNATSKNNTGDILLFQFWENKSNFIIIFLQ